MGLSAYSQSLVSCARILAYLEMDEAEDYVNRTPKDTDKAFIKVSDTSHHVSSCHIMSHMTLVLIPPLTHTPSIPSLHPLER